MKILFFFLFVLILPTQAMAEETECSAFGASNQLPVAVYDKLMMRTKLLCNKGYAALTSDVSHGPLWSAEHLKREDVISARELRRTGYFYPDTRFFGSADLSDYRHSGYTRGHMAPSGDQPSEEAQQETFALTNVVPQTAALNEGIWARAEARVRKMAIKLGELYVVTGPAFHLKPIQTIGKNHVYIPSATWKAVYSPTLGKAEAYVCRNAQKQPHCTQVTITTLIRNTGIDPFPGISDQIKQQAWRLPSP